MRKVSIASELLRKLAPTPDQHGPSPAVKRGEPGAADAARSAGERPERPAPDGWPDKLPRS